MSSEAICVPMGTNNSLINHICRIENVPNPDMYQYMTLSHCYAWSFNKEKKFPPFQSSSHITPSPNEYHINDISSKLPLWSFPKEEEKQKREKSPGPGDYNEKKFVGEEGPKYSVPKDGAVFSSSGPSTKSPGPADYEPKDTANATMGPSYTFGVKKERDTKKDIPGVGTYELRKGLDPQGVKFDKAPREGPEKLSESPYLYTSLDNDKIRFLKYDENAATKGPIWTFSKDKKGDKNINKGRNNKRASTPGPGSYKHRVYVGNEGPKYSFRKDKFKPDYISPYPAPNHYQQSIRYIPDTPIYSISEVKRPKSGKNVFKKSLFPGPGTYNPNFIHSSTKRKFPAWKLNPPHRPESSKNQYRTPGPGAYNSKLGRMPEGPKYSMGKKYKYKNWNETPGPGKYEAVFKTHPSEPKYSIGKSIRDDEINKIKKNNYPAPCAYNIKDSKMTNKISFTKDKRYKGDRNNFPGPGSYNIPCSFDYISDLTRSKGVFDPRYRYIGYNTNK